MIREAAREIGEPIGILLDLSGPKFRLGEVPNGAVEAKEGDIVTLSLLPADGALEFPLPEVHAAAQVGDRILIADGGTGLAVTAKDTSSLTTQVVDAGPIKNRQGVTLLGRDIEVSAITPQDIYDLKRGAELGVDWVAASFVRSAEDMLSLRRLLEQAVSPAKTMAKIETKRAVENLEQIVLASDGVMIARGDLGLQTPFEDIPHLQRRITHLCLRHARPVITATQMLESMMENSRPTRAEATDVANAVLDGTDALMLSGETAVGAHPALVVETMARIAERADEEQALSDDTSRYQPTIGVASTEGVAQAACALAHALSVDAIVSCTTSGSTARLVSKFRPDAPIVAVCPRPAVYYQLTLAWGVRPILSAAMASVDDLIELAYRVAIDEGYLEKGQRVVITAGVPPGSEGRTNLIMVGEVVDKRDTPFPTQA